MKKNTKKAKLWTPDSSELFSLGFRDIGQRLVPGGDELNGERLYVFKVVPNVEVLYSFKAKTFGLSLFHRVVDLYLYSPAEFRSLIVKFCKK